MKEIDVTAIQRGCVHDGSGIRTTVFLRGCLLRCPWCCNPETWTKDEYFFDSSKCLLEQGINSPLCNGCIKMGGKKDVSECPFHSSKPVSQGFTADELYELIIRDKAQFSSTGGGVTFSGGEPMLQAVSLLPLLRQLQEEKINICFETTLVAPESDINLVRPFIDEIIIDLKLQPKMNLRNEGYVSSITSLLKTLPSTMKRKYRLVFINEMSDCKDDIVDKLRRLNIKELELLKAHNLGESKYRKLHLQPKDYSADTTLFSEFAEYLIADGIKVSKLTI